MDEIGIDITKHRSKTFDDLEDTSFDLIISLSPEAQHSAVEMTRTMACEVEFWPTMDPSMIEGTPRGATGRLSRRARHADGPHPRALPVYRARRRSDRVYAFSPRTLRILRARSWRR